MTAPPILASVRFTRSCDGQSLVEVALSLSVLVFLLIGGADLARAYAAQVGVINSARAGAEAGAIKKATTDAAIESYAYDELSRVAGVDADAADITVTHTTEMGVDLLTVRVRYTFRTLVAWPLIPTILDLDRSVVMREY